MIDASVVLAGLFGEEATIDQLSEAVEQSDLIAPPIWRLETLQAVLKRERRQLITRQTADRYLHQLGRLGVRIHSLRRRSLIEEADFARPHQLSVYDATYVRLALQMQCGMMTHDGNIRAAAFRLNIPLIE